MLIGAIGLVVGTVCGGATASVLIFWLMIKQGFFKKGWLD